MNLVEKEVIIAAVAYSREFTKLLQPDEQALNELLEAVEAYESWLKTQARLKEPMTPVQSPVEQDSGGRGWVGC